MKLATCIAQQRCDVTKISQLGDNKEYTEIVIVLGTQRDGSDWVKHCMTTEAGTEKRTSEKNLMVSRSIWKFLGYCKWLQRAMNNWNKWKSAAGKLTLKYADMKKEVLAETWDYTVPQLTTISGRNENTCKKKCEHRASSTVTSVFHSFRDVGYFFTVFIKVGKHLGQ